jgi:hypothetical protein
MSHHVDDVANTQALSTRFASEEINTAAAILITKPISSRMSYGRVLSHVGMNIMFFRSNSAASQV